MKPALERFVWSGWILPTIAATCVLALLLGVFERESLIPSVIGFAAMVLVAIATGFYGYSSGHPRMATAGIATTVLWCGFDLTTSPWGFGHSLFQYRLPFEEPNGGGLVPFVVKVVLLAVAFLFLYKLVRLVADSAADS